MKHRIMVGVTVAFVAAVILAAAPAKRTEAYEKMLVKPKAKICFVCHGDKEKVFKESGHGKFDVTCQTCHNPHGAGQEKMLTKPSKDVCMMCHSDMKQHYMATGHGKAELACSMCHNPHGTPSEDAAKPAPKK